MNQAENPNQAVAQRIRRLREQKGMSQKEIATALSLTTTAYSRIEAGQTQLTINNLFNIADKLSEPITTLLGLPDSGIAHNHHSVVMSNFNSGHIHIDIDAAKMLNNLKGKI